MLMCVYLHNFLVFFLEFVLVQNYFWISNLFCGPKIWNLKDMFLLFFLLTLQPLWYSKQKQMVRQEAALENWDWHFPNIFWHSKAQTIEKIISRLTDHENNSCSPDGACPVYATWLAITFTLIHCVWEATNSLHKEFWDTWRVDQVTSDRRGRADARLYELSVYSGKAPSDVLYQTFYETSSVLVRCSMWQKHWLTQYFETQMYYSMQVWGYSVQHWHVVIVQKATDKCKCNSTHGITSWQTM